MAGDCAEQAASSAPARTWWKPCDQYWRSLATLSRTDAWLACAVVVATYADTFATGRWYAAGQRSDADTLLRGFVELGVLLAVVALLLTARRQPWSTVGFGTANLCRSVRAGLVIVVVFLGGSWLVSAAIGGPWRDPRLVTFGLPFYLGPVALDEELVFRGFITTRLAAAFPRRWIGVVAGGVVFGLVHLVAHLAYGGTLASAIATGWWQVLVPFGWHFLLWWLYARYDSLAAPILLHLCMNLSGVVLGTTPL